MVGRSLGSHRGLSGVPRVNTSLYDVTDMAANRSSGAGFALVGLVVGGIVGFLLRPSVPLLGQLPFETVITRGANLNGLNQLLIPTAQKSFNILLAGAILGAILGWIGGLAAAR